MSNEKYGNEGESNSQVGKLMCQGYEVLLGKSCEEISIWL